MRRITLILCFLIAATAQGRVPEVDFGGLPRFGLAPCTLQFNDSTAYSPTSWKWYFGDGDSSTSQNPSHVYDTAGVYRVDLIATNGSGSDTLVNVDYIRVTDPWYRDMPSNTSPITISSLPYTCNTDGTTDSLQKYVLSGNLTSLSDGIIFPRGARWIEIDGGGDTIIFDGDSTGGAKGLWFDDGSWDTTKHVIVKNLTVLQYETAEAVEYGSYGGSNVAGVYLHGWIMLDLALVNVNVHVYGHSSRAIDQNDDTRMAGIEINGGDWTHYVNSFDSRTDLDAAVIALGSGQAVSPLEYSDYNFYVHGVTINECPHAGIIVGAVAWVDSNTVTVDAHNEKPATSWANAHAISDYGSLQSGSCFMFNYMRSGNNHGGGRGMYFAEGVGSAEVAYNDIQMDEGDNTETATSRGIRIRWGPDSLYIHHNTIIVRATDRSGDSSAFIGEGAHAIWFSDDADYGGNGRYCRIKKNYLEAMYIGSGTNEGKPWDDIAALMYDCYAVDSIGWGNLHEISDNILVSNIHCLQIGNDGARGYQGTFLRDSLVWVAPYWSDCWGWTGAIGHGSDVANATQNRVIDAWFGGDDDSLMTQTSGVNDSSGVAYMRTVYVTVLGSNDSVVIGAEVRFIDNYDNEYVDSTGSNGVAIGDTLPMLRQTWDSPNTVDSVFNPYTLIVTSEGDTTVVSTVLADDSTAVLGSQEFTVVLEATLGTGEEDPAPPVAAFSGTPTSGTASLEVTFTDASTNSPTSWDWDWGDETSHGTTQNPTHIYTAAGTYTVTLTATNVYGNDSEIKTGYITVSAAPASNGKKKNGGHHKGGKW